MCLTRLYAKPSAPNFQLVLIRNSLKNDWTPLQNEFPSYYCIGETAAIGHFTLKYLFLAIEISTPLLLSSSKISLTIRVIDCNVKLYVLYNKNNILYIVFDGKIITF